VTDTAPEHDRSGYWYPDEDPSVRAVDVLNLLRRYRGAESRMRRRTRDSMRMGETDLAALRHLFAASRRSEEVSPSDLARRLDISSASVSVLLDRLERSGHVLRAPSPRDRRRVVVTATPDSEREVRETLGEMHRRMHAAAAAMTPSEAAAVMGFLSSMIEAVDAVDAVDAVAARGAADRV
jgi:DNA-binding MarR family transcriptional regulator